VPFLEEALLASESELVFPGITPDTDLPQVLRRALARAGIVKGFEHRCRRCGCGYRERTKDNTLLFCPKHKYRLWPIALVRQLRFHDLRHTAIHLLFDAGLDVPVVQAFARHRDPKITVQLYGHLRAEWILRKIEGVDLLRRDAITPETTLATRGTITTHPNLGPEITPGIPHPSELMPPFRRGEIGRGQVVKQWKTRFQRSFSAGRQSAGWRSLPAF
jgi:hypothetical protein